MIILDLEWNRSYDKTPLDEILQIGAVRVDRIGGPILDTFCAYIRPAVHKKFDPGAKKLPELQSSIESKVSFPEALERFRTWCGDEENFAAWGGGDDFKALNQNCAYWNQPSIRVEGMCNLQLAFSRLVGTGQQVALWRAVKYCGIPDVFDFHNALYDALYTAIVGEWITPEALVGGPAASKKRKQPLRLSRLSFSKQPRQKVGPYGDPEEVLNAKAGRQPACPLCGRRGSISRWCYIKPKRKEPPKTYYSAFRCVEHGRFLCRLTLAVREDGTWLGRRAVPPVTPELTREYEAAKQGGTYICQGRGKRKKRGVSPKKAPREKFSNRA